MSSSIQAITYEGAKAVTLSDSVKDPAGPFAGLLVTATGNLKFTTITGDTVALTAVANNAIIPIAISRVWSTGTSATVVGLGVSPYTTRPST